MNEPTPPPLPSADAPPVLPSAVWPREQPLGSLPEEKIGIPSLAAAIEAILRQPRRVMFQLRQPDAGRLIVLLLVIAIVCSAIYGAVVGAFSGGQQLWAAPVKIVAGLFLSALICLPSLYIFACLSGSTGRLAEIWGLLAGLLTLMTVLLVGFAPVAWVFSQSTKSETLMGSLHLAFWIIATFFGLRFLHTGFTHTHARSKAGLNVWILIFLLVALQMTTSLRPILGSNTTFLPDPKDKQFFISHWINCLDADQPVRKVD